MTAAATEMPAGRELDALVAEKVIGLKVKPITVIDGRGPHSDVGTVSQPYKMADGRMGVEAKRIPAYSADWAAAALVVDRLVANPLDTFGLHCMDGRWVASFRLANRGRDPYDDAEGRGEAPTAPHAISLAALAVKAAEA